MSDGGDSKVTAYAAVQCPAFIKTMTVDHSRDEEITIDTMSAKRKRIQSIPTELKRIQSTLGKVKRIQRIPSNM